MNEIKFSMTYIALKMFGKQLYANISAAIAELVANGLDANAQNVYVYMDIRNKEQACIEIFDDGTGMDIKDLQENYAKIGRNKRDFLSTDEATKQMGRKGIGKLAALYLTDTYYIITKRADTDVCTWKLDVTNQADDAEPKLEEYSKKTDAVLYSKLIQSQHGTIIRLENVKVKNFGTAAEDALEQKLANYFLTDNLEQEIKLCVLKNIQDKIDFMSVKKNIAFKNMAVIFSSNPNDFQNIAKDDVIFIDKLLPAHGQNYRKKREILKFPENIDTNVNNEHGNKKHINRKTNGTIVIDNKKFRYSLKGWIGIHSTIDTKEAQKNADNFRKNMHYNPNQIRIYVRNKLATSNFLNYLGLSATYSNYLEGELSFDILDVEELEDISTAGRDNFSVQDERIQLLIALTKGLSNKLISKRQSIATEMANYRKQLEDNEEEEKKSNIRNYFRNGQVKSKKIFDKMPEPDRVAIETDFFQFTRAANLSNATKTIFISHKADCAQYGNFIIDILLKIDKSLKNNIVFTSNQQYGVPQGMDICDYLNTCFRDDMYVIFLFSKSFYDSNMCIAEAGAAWGTNKYYTNFVIDMDFKDITKPINNFQKGASLADRSEEGIRIFADELIRIIETVGITKNIVQQDVIDIIKTTLNEYTRNGKDLKLPTYIPHRKFQAVPQCPKCNHAMNITITDNGNYEYSCECGKKQRAKIE